MAEHERGNLCHRAPDPKPPTDRETDDEASDDDAASVASTETALGLAPDAFRLVKSEVLRLRGTIQNLEKEKRRAENEVSKRDFSILELEKKKREVERDNLARIEALKELKQSERAAAQYAKKLESPAAARETSSSPRNLDVHASRRRRDLHQASTEYPRHRGAAATFIRGRPSRRRRDPPRRKVSTE